MNAEAEQTEYQVEEDEEQFARLIAKCWEDDAFKARLLADTAETLKAEGFEVGEGVTVKAVEDTDSVFHLVIPARPTELSDEDLDGVVGGAYDIRPAGSMVRITRWRTGTPAPTFDNRGKPSVTVQGPGRTTQDLGSFVCPPGGVGRWKAGLGKKWL